MFAIVWSLLYSITRFSLKYFICKQPSAHYSHNAIHFSSDLVKEDIPNSSRNLSHNLHFPWDIASSTSRLLYWHLIYCFCPDTRRGYLLTRSISLWRFCLARYIRRHSTSVLLRLDVVPVKERRSRLTSRGVRMPLECSRVLS